VTVRFYAELNDLLPLERRQRDVEVPLPSPRSVKDLVEALGVPHTEVDLILVNGRPAGFAYALAAGDRISVYPVFEAFDLAGVVGVDEAARLRPRPLRDTRFVLDGHLGKLARYLRLLGFDALWSSDATDEELASVSCAERRILLTRDRGLLKRSEVTHGACVRSTDPKTQLAEVVARFQLSGSTRPFTRCLACNAPLVAVEKTGVAARLPPRVREAYDELWLCPACDKVYWKGSHYDRMRRMLGDVLR
jgi:uncharacterized protein with PIN domain